MHAALNKAIRGTLVANAQIVAAVGQKIYPHVIPGNVALPGIVYFHMAGGKTNTTAVAMLDVRYTVKVITQEDPATAGAVAQLIYNALADVRLVVDGWNGIKCREIDMIDYSEQEERVNYYHAGHVFRIRA